MILDDNAASTKLCTKKRTRSGVDIARPFGNEILPNLREEHGEDPRESQMARLEELAESERQNIEHQSSVSPGFDVIMGYSATWVDIFSAGERVSRKRSWFCPDINNFADRLQPARITT